MTAEEFWDKIDREQPTNKDVWNFMHFNKEPQKIKWVPGYKWEMIPTKSLGTFVVNLN